MSDAQIRTQIAGYVKSVHPHGFAYVCTSAVGVVFVPQSLAKSLEVGSQVVFDAKQEWVASANDFGWNATTIHEVAAPKTFTAFGLVTKIPLNRKVPIDGSVKLTHGEHAESKVVLTVGSTRDSDFEPAQNMPCEVVYALVSNGAHESLLVTAFRTGPAIVKAIKQAPKEAKDKAA